jgi:hypothetical protein
MPTDHILALLIAERDKLNQALAALSGGTVKTGKRRGRPPKNPVAVPAAADYTDPTMPDWVKPKSKAAPTPEPARTKRKMSAAGRRAIREGVRRRWAAVRAAKTEEAAPKRAPSRKSAIIAATTPSAEETEFKAKMSAAMKAAWAKRKKAAAKKAKAA